jgi:hypothetical protein
MLGFRSAVLYSNCIVQCCVTSHDSFSAYGKIDIKDFYADEIRVESLCFCITLALLGRRVFGFRHSARQLDLAVVTSVSHIENCKIQSYVYLVSMLIYIVAGKLLWID